MIGPDPTDLLATQGVAIMAIPMIVQWMKTTNLPVFSWIRGDTARVAHAVAWLLGAAAAVGIHVSAHMTGGAFHFVIDGLTLHTAFVVAGQLIGQQHVYNFIQLVEAMKAVATNSAGGLKP